MLERVALQQSRFRTPGLAAGPRGVALGEKLALLFPSLDRVVAFFRAYASEESLGELLHSLRIVRVTTSMKTSELLVFVATDSVDRADGVAGYAKLTSGLVFTGSSAHFVRYRDVASPLGYDTDAVSDARGDVVLYDETFSQAYSIEREISFRDLILRLSPEPRHGDREGPLHDVVLTAEPGVAPAVLRYLYRWRIDARVGIGEWPPASAFDDRTRKLHLFLVRELPARMRHLFASMPGVVLFLRPTPGIAVELGHAHPIPLEGASRLFGDSTLVLFRHGRPAETLSPLPHFADVAAVVAPAIETGDPSTETGMASAEIARLALPLRLRPSVDAAKNTCATMIEGVQLEWLRRLIYVLPQRVLAGARIARTASHLVILTENATSALPLGTFMSRVAERTYVPLGLAIEPALDPALLRSLLEGSGSDHVFLGSFGALRIADADFRPLLREVLTGVATTGVDALPLAADLHAPLVTLEYGEEDRDVLDALDAEPAR
jgi:hypothetical protein